MSDEVQKVLGLFLKEKVTADEAERLLGALWGAPVQTPAAPDAHQVYESLTVEGDAHFGQDVRVSKKLETGGTLEVGKDLHISGGANVRDSLHVNQALHVSGSMRVGNAVDAGGNIEISGGCGAGDKMTVGGDAAVSGSLKVGSCFTVAGNMDLSGHAETGGEAHRNRGPPAGWRGEQALQQGERYRPPRPLPRNLSPQA